MRLFWSKNKRKEEERLRNSASKIVSKEELAEISRKADEKDERKYKARHALYDFSKKIVTSFRSVFGEKITKSQEKRHVGRTFLRKREIIHLGGTKPMSQYTGDDGSKWLAKQAVNCMGFHKIEGVLLTVAGANVQKLVDPETAVDAYHGKTVEDGEVSFQRRLSNTVSSKTFDLFKFSKHPELADEETIGIVEDLGDQIMREHVTDWLLCNFDTKGENFVITESEKGWVLHGIDKEAAFNNLGKPEAQHMSTDFKPHANNTLYNVVFEMYKQGKMDLNLDVMKDKIRDLVNMSTDEYMENFREYLEHVKKTNPDKYAETYMMIRERKQSLGEEYNLFFTDLVKERMKNVSPEEAKELKRKYFEGGTKCKLFEPRDRSPKALVQDKLIRLREELNARIAQGKPDMETVAKIMAMADLKNIFEEMVRKGKTTENDLEAVFSDDAISKRISGLKNNRVVGEMMSRVTSGEIRLADVAEEYKVSMDIEDQAREHIETPEERRQREIEERERQRQETEDLVNAPII